MLSRRTALVVAAALAFGLAGFPASATKLYWSVLFSQIERANVSGSMRQTLVGGVGIVHGLALDLNARKMYWTNVHGLQGVFRSNLNGSARESLVTAGLVAPSGLALDVSGGKMYWTDIQSGKIQRANLDGSVVEDLVTGLSEPFAIALNLRDDRMIWTDRFTGKIQSADLDGANQVDLATGLGEPTAVALDLIAGKMYWAEKAPPRIRRADLTGAGTEDLVTAGLKSPLSLALDRRMNRMYWTNSDMSLAMPSRIQQADLNGSGVADVLTFPVGFHPVAITFDPQIELEIPTVSDWGLLVLALSLLIAAILRLRSNWPPGPASRDPIGGL